MDRPTANTATGRLFFHAIITIFDFVNILPFGNTKSKLVLILYCTYLSVYLHSRVGRWPARVRMVVEFDAALCDLKH